MNITNYFLLVLAATMLVIMGCGSDPEIPPSVVSSFEQKYPTAENLDWKERDGLYVVDAKGRVSVPATFRQALAGQPLADPRHPHLLARRRGGGGREEVGGQPPRSSAPLLRLPLDGGAPRRGDGSGRREEGEPEERRVDRRQQRHRHPEAQQPPQGGEHRHVHVVEHEHLVSQDRQVKHRSKCSRVLAEELVEHLSCGDRTGRQDDRLPRVTQRSDFGRCNEPM